jgi:hypothetical protein
MADDALDPPLSPSLCDADDDAADTRNKLQALAEYAHLLAELDGLVCPVGGASNYCYMSLMPVSGRGHVANNGVTMRVKQLCMTARHRPERRARLSLLFVFCPELPWPDGDFFLVSAERLGCLLIIPQDEIRLALEVCAVSMDEHLPAFIDSFPPGAPERHEYNPGVWMMCSADALFAIDDTAFSSNDLFAPGGVLSLTSWHDPGA